MIQKIDYGCTTPTGLIVKVDITTDLWKLHNLTTSLDSSGYDLITYNTQGIVIKLREIISITDDYQLNTRLDGLEGRLWNLEDKEIVITMKKEEVTDDFFILLDLLPKHIRKELKIYIK